MRKNLSNAFCLILFFCVLGFFMQTGRDNKENIIKQAFATEKTEALKSHNREDKIHIIATSFHEYDWLRQIIGTKALDPKEGNIALTLLIDNGVDMHSFEPTIQDVRMILNADLFVYNGGNSDSWVRDILNHLHTEKERNLKKNTLRSLNIMDVLGSAREGDSHDHHDHHEHANCTHEHHDHEHHDHEHHDHEHHDHEHHEHEHHEHAHVHLSDEHIWLSLKYAMGVCQKMNLILAELDPKNKEVYARNTKKYIESLEKLHKDFQIEIQNAPRDTILVADRFPFVYLVEDYGIKYFAAFHGCSAETEASFQTIAFLAQKVDALNLHSLFILEKGLENLAQTIINNSKNKECAILELNSMQSILKEDIENGANYRSIMEQNFEALKKALAE